MFSKQERITSSNSLHSLVHITHAASPSHPAKVLNNSTSLSSLVVLIKCISYVACVKNGIKSRNLDCLWFSDLLYFIRLGKGGNGLLVFALAGAFKFLSMSMCVCVRAF